MKNLKFRLKLKIAAGKLIVIKILFVGLILRWTIICTYRLKGAFILLSKDVVYYILARFC